MDASNSWPSSEQFDRDRLSALVRWGRNVTRPIPARDIDSVWVNKEYGERRAACVFDHELISVVGVELVLIGETKAARFSDAAVPFIWYGRIGSAQCGLYRFLTGKTERRGARSSRMDHLNLYCPEPNP